MGRTQAKHAAIHGGGVVGVIEHHEVGELLLAQFARHVIERKQAVGHTGEGEAMLRLVPHQHVEAERIARQRQAPRARVPDRCGEGPAQERPDRVTELFPGGQQHARVGPRIDVARAKPDPRDEFVAIIEPEIGCDQRAACAPFGLAVETVFGRHAHQPVHQPDGTGCDHVRTIGTVLREGIGCPGQGAAVHRRAVETQQPGDGAHAEPP